MVFFAGGGTPPSPPQHVDIRSVVDDQGREAYARVMAEAYGVYGAPKTSILSHFAPLASVIGPTKQAFLAYRNGLPVAGAILSLPPRVGVGAWSGTLPGE